MLIVVSSFYMNFNSTDSLNGDFETMARSRKADELNEILFRLRTAVPLIREKFEAYNNNDDPSKSVESRAEELKYFAKNLRSDLVPLVTIDKLKRVQKQRSRTFYIRVIALSFLASIGSILLARVLGGTFSLPDFFITLPSEIFGALIMFFLMDRFWANHETFTGQLELFRKEMWILSDDARIIFDNIEKLNSKDASLEHVDKLERQVSTLKMRLVDLLENLLNEVLYR